MNCPQCGLVVEPDDSRVIPYRGDLYHVQCWFKKIDLIGRHQERPHVANPGPFVDMQANAEVEQKRQRLRGMIVACDSLLDQIKDALGNVFCGQSEFVNPEGGCGILLTVDRDMLKGADKKETNARHLVLVSGLSEVKKYLLQQAERASLRPFVFVVQYKDGTVIMSGSLQ